MYEFIVKDGDLDGHVNILKKTCSCREFRLDHLPCEHALAVCRYREHYLYMICVLITILVKHGLQHMQKQYIFLAYKKNERF